MKIILILILASSFIGCKNENRYYKNNSSPFSNYDDYVDGYSDGIYCAEVEYYYSKTGTRSTYTLEVEIKNNELTVIYWPNGGWLDSSHFYPPDISSGYAEFESDRGGEYTVEIIGEEGECYTSRYAPNEKSFVSDEEDQICSRCGGYKYEYDNYCSSCTDDIENTCLNCGAYEYGVYGGLCSNCQDKNDDEDW